jgi:hypothetical protein
VNNREWKVFYEEYDFFFAAGVGVGLYRNGEPVLRNAVCRPTPDQQGFTPDQMASALRDLADWVEANKDELT